MNKFYEPNKAKKGRTNTCWGGFIDNIDKFDAKFFGISPREASMLDPQQRLLLQVCYEALEDGGQVVEKLAGSATGVFVGGFALDWKLMQFSESNRELIDSHSATGSMMTMLSNRISYVFDLKGPAISVDTACSSSLVAVHLACQSIWNNESKMAIAGGSNIMIKPEFFIAESKAGMLSPDGRSKTYDASANGYVRGEGVGMVILKPFSQALADGDPIHALIVNSGCNQDGHTSGITVPNGDAQNKLMREVYSQAGINPADIQYVEAHGTGTPVGDPIEINAIGDVLSEGRRADSPCIVGSVKTNIGHTEAAAGVAALIKTVLCLEHGMIPKHLHLKNINSKINFEKLNIKVPTENMKWPETQGTKKAGINSFGFGGTNAHVLLEEYVPELEKNIEDDSEHNLIFPFSAKSENSLQMFLRSIKDLKSENDRFDLNGLGYSLSHRRSHYDKRVTITAKTKKELNECIDSYLVNQTRPEVVKGNLSDVMRKSVFVFTGMGSQWWKMGQQLYEEELIFHSTLEEVDKIFTKMSGWSILQEMLKSEDLSEMSETRIAQPANFALQVALSKLLESWGIKADIIIGHSAGEAASVYIAGALSLEDAVKVIYTRSRLQQLTTGQGKMVAVSLSYEQALDVIEKHKDLVSVAAINSLSSVTLSGDEKALEKICANLDEQSIYYKYLNVKVPYHSHYMEMIKEEVFESLKDLHPMTGKIPLYSTVTGTLIDGKELDNKYWWENIRQAVLFAKGCESIIGLNYDCTFIEIGPHPVLSSSINECLDKLDKKGTTIPTLRRKFDESVTMLSLLGNLYVQGFDINWDAFFNKNEAFTKYPLYPWNGERFWQESHKSEINRMGEDVHQLLGYIENAPGYVWENELCTNNVHYITDHKIQNTVTFPGAGYVEMSLSAVREIYGYTASIEVADIEFNKAMFLPDDKDVKTKFIYDKDTTSFQIFSQTIDGKYRKNWDLNAFGIAYPTNKDLRKKYSVEELKKNCTVVITKEECYKQFKTLGLVYGDSFQGIKELRQGESEAFAYIEIREALENDVENYTIHPAVLDICFQVLAAALPFENEMEGAKVYMPTGVKSGAVIGKLQKKMLVYAKINEKDGNLIRGDILLMDEYGNLILQINNCKAVSLKNESHVNKPQEFYELAWSEQELKEREEQENDIHNTWMIFADKKGFSDLFIKQLEKKGKKVFVVYDGSQYQMNEKDATIGKKNTKHYKRLVSDMAKENKCKIDRIVHFWSLDIAETEELSYEKLINAEDYGTHSVLFLMHALEEDRMEGMPKVWLVTNNSQSVSNLKEDINIAQSSLWGMGRVIGHQEYMDFYGGLIDIDATDLQGNVKLIYKEIINHEKEDQVAFRNGRRYVARFIEASNMENQVPILLNSDSTYLITGGFGSLGTLFAKWMIEHGARRIILMGRKELLKRSEWNLVDENSEAAKRIAIVRSLEAMGASIHLAAVDLTSKEELNRFVEDFSKEGWPEIKGIIHSAGVAIPKLMINMDAEAFDEALHPKVFGAWNLHEAFKDKSIDFFVLFSSIAALVVSGGQGNYAAGNSFMDALAHYRYSKGMPAVSINWGPWAEVGMATQLDSLTYFWKRGIYPIIPNQGINAFEYAIGQTKPQLAVIGAEWPLIGDKNYPLGIYPEMISDLVAKNSEEDLSEKENNNINTQSFLENYALVSGEIERVYMMQEFVKDIVALVMRVNREEIQNEQTLISWGLDSMLAIELKNSIEKNLKIMIAVVDLLKGPSIEELSANLIGKIEESGKLNETRETAEIVDALDDLSKEELEALLKEIAQE